MFSRLQDPDVIPYDLVVFDECHKLSADREPADMNQLVGQPGMKVSPYLYGYGLVDWAHEAMAKGDIVLFGDPFKWDAQTDAHAAIYAGGGQIWNETTKGVQLTPVNQIGQVLTQDMIDAYNSARGGIWLSSSLVGEWYPYTITAVLHTHLDDQAVTDHTLPPAPIQAPGTPWAPSPYQASIVARSSAGTTYTPLATPIRIVDTRAPYGVGLQSKLVSNFPSTFTVAGAQGIPANATAVTATVVAVNETCAALYLGPVPLANPQMSSPCVNPGDGSSVDLTVALGSDGSLSATYVAAWGQVADLVLDVTGYYAPDQNRSASPGPSGSS